MNRLNLWSFAAASVVVVLLSGCGGSLAVRHQRDLDKLIEARDLDLDQVVRPDRVNEEMREWLYRTVPPRPNSEDRLFDLLMALENRKDVELQYEAGYTGTAAEVFATGKYNCLSYSHLFLALAREVGVDASYYRVVRSRRFRREGDVVLVSGHVTVGFGPAPNERLIKFNVRSDADYRTAKAISDLTALGLYYSNRGSEMISDGEFAKAKEWLEVATRLAPHLPGNWVNLGVARRRLGDLEGAEKDYLRALEIGERFFPAYRNLAALYQLRGEEEMRARMMSLLGGRGNRNPYTWLALGDHALDQGLIEEARDYYRRSLRLAADPAEPMAALGLLALREGDLEEAREWLEKARAAGPAVERIEELELALDPVRQIGVESDRSILIE
jgi:Flp pilus assembly protein TadD